jgi:hypothetical protein
MSQRLPDLQNECVIEQLPPLNPRFFIPRLTDKPQNPIMDSLKLSQDLKRLPVLSSKSIAQEPLDPVVKLSGLNQPTSLQMRDLWNALLNTKAPSKVIHFFVSLPFAHLLTLD